MLDRYAGAEEAAALCGRIAGELEALAKEREEFDRQTPDEAERSRLELQLEDIDKVNPAPGEDEELSARFKVAGNSRQVLETAGQLGAFTADCSNCRASMRRWRRGCLRSATGFRKM